jgi:predicted nucleotide-binding protein (sugar kinase/HSP70/actin superfamily)
MGARVIGKRTLLVGGLSSVHDPLLVAALEGAGIPAEQLHPRTNAGLARARALGNHGQCNPAHYAVGAVLEHANKTTDIASTRAWLTLGSCGPCRLASFSVEWAQILAGAGLGRLPVIAIEEIELTLEPGPLKRASDTLLVALVAGDVLVKLGHALRPYVIDPLELEEALTEATGAIAGALSRRSPIAPVLARAAHQFRSIRRDFSRVLPRALVVGEPWTTLADGDPSYDLARKLGLHGVEIDAPSAADWLRYRLWGRTDVAARHCDRRIQILRRRIGRWFGLQAPRADDMHDLARLASAHYDPNVRGGSAHLEVGRALRAARDRTAHLVISIKPFGCLPSSSLLDGILSVLAREGKTPPLVIVETTGNANAVVESRLEMAIEGARSAAEREIEAARRGRDEDYGALLPPHGPRRFACTAAEILARRA